MFYNARPIMHRPVCIQPGSTSSLAEPSGRYTVLYNTVEPLVNEVLYITNLFYKLLYKYYNICTSELSKQ